MKIDGVRLLWIRLNLKYNNDRGIFRQKNRGTVSLLVLLCVCVCAKSLPSWLTLCNPMDTHHVAHQAPLSMVFSRQKDWRCPPPGDLPNPGIRPVLRLLHWQEGSLPQAPSGKPTVLLYSPPKPILNHFLVISALDSGLCSCGFF